MICLKGNKNSNKINRILEMMIIIMIKIKFQKMNQKITEFKTIVNLDLK